MSNGHSELGPSAAHRWMRCYASVAASRGVEDKSSAAADEGTLAHEIAAQVLTQKKYQYKVANHPAILELGTENAAPLQTYVDFVLEKAAGNVLYVEVKLDLTRYVGEGGFGTADAVIYHPAEKRLTTCDLKFGQGNVVYATDREGENETVNPQLGMYGLGAYDVFDHLDVDDLELIIHQPRRDHISATVLTREQLAEFALRVLHAVEQIKVNGHVFTPGEKQCQWCPIRATCQARAAWHLEAFQRETLFLTPFEVSKYLSQVGDFRAWCDALEEYAMQRLHTDAKAIPGWKLVEGRSVRQWNADAEQKLIDMYGPQAFNKKLIGLTEAEKLMGKKLAAEIMPTITVRGKGKPALAPESDPRPPLADAAEGFTVETE